MAIERYEINGDLSALKTALQATGLFDSVTLDSDSTPTLLTCKDEDNHTLFTVEAGSSWTYTAYKDAETSVQTTGTSYVAEAKYLYKVGDSAVIEVPNAILLAMGKTNTGAVGFAIPAEFSNTANKGNVKVAYWGDDVLMSNNLIFSVAQNPMVGNHCQFVEVPMHGTYSQNVYLQDVFYLPIAQPGLRGVIQEITGLAGTYLTNGYLAAVERGT